MKSPLIYWDLCSKEGQPQGLPLQDSIKCRSRFLNPDASGTCAYPKRKWSDAKRSTRFR